MSSGVKGGGRVMDTSKEYIEMCRKAEEVQKLWKPVPGDFAYDIRYKDPIIIINYDKNTYIYGFNLVNELEFEECVLYFNSENDLIWRPRQDQLQGMLFTKWYHQDEVAQISTFSNWCKQNWIWGNSTEGHCFNSHEQLWLAFVMHEKYQKKWDGKKWHYAEQNLRSFT
jgi:hypothetical protein